MDKLFEIPAQKRNEKFRFVTYKNNRIASKLIKLLKEGGIFKVKEEESSGENIIFEISIITDEDFIKSKLFEEIISYIPDNFTPNYRFNFSGEPSLGFVYSFVIYYGGREFKTCYHKIKEIRKGAPMPSSHDQIILY